MCGDVKRTEARGACLAGAPRMGYLRLGRPICSAPGTSCEGTLTHRAASVGAGAFVLELTIHSPEEGQPHPFGEVVPGLSREGLRRRWLRRYEGPGLRFRRGERSGRRPNRRRATLSKEDQGFPDPPCALERSRIRTQDPSRRGRYAVCRRKHTACVNVQATFTFLNEVA